VTSKKRLVDGDRRFGAFVNCNRDKQGSSGSVPATKTPGTLLSLVKGSVMIPRFLSRLQPRSIERSEA
jgi:hypothetical protein